MRPPRSRPAKRCLIPVWVVAAAMLAQPALGAGEEASEAFDAGVTAAKRGHHEEALERYRAARDAGLDTAALHHNMGSAYFRLGRYDQARRAFKEAAQHPRMTALAYYNLGRVAEATEDDGAALHWFRRAYDTAGTEKLRRMAAQKLDVGYQADKPYWVYVEALAGFDSNPRLAADNDPLQSGTAGDAVGGAFASGQHLLSGNWQNGLLVTGSAYGELHADLGGQDLASVEGGLGLNRALGNWQTRYRLTGNRLWLGGDGLLTGIRGEIGASRDLGRRYELDLRARSEYIDGDTQFDFLDGTRQEARVRLDAEYGLWRWQATYTFELNDRDGQTVGNDFFSVSPIRNEIELEAGRHLFGAYTGHIGLGFRDSLFREDEVRGGTNEGERDDERMEASLGVSRPLPKLWTLRVEATYRDKSSSFQQFEHDRVRVTASVGKTF